MILTWFQIYGNSAVHYVDDLYGFFLDDVSLTVTPASEANSQENGGIQVTGLDRCVRDITGKLGAKQGKVILNWTPRHGDGNFTMFNSADPYICVIYKDSQNFITLYHDSNNSIRTYTRVANDSKIDTWTASITAGSTYLLEIEYGGTEITVTIAGTKRLTTTYSGGVDFGANIPDTVYIGHYIDYKKQCDAVFSAP